MSINIPEVSKEYREALIIYLLGLSEKERSDFYYHLTLVAGYCQSVEISSTMCGMGGALSIEELLQTSTGFKNATFTEFLKFYKEGYSSEDFMHIFMDAYLSIRIDMSVPLTYV